MAGDIFQPTFFSNRQFFFMTDIFCSQPSKTFFHPVVYFSNGYFCFPLGPGGYFPPLPFSWRFFFCLCRFFCLAFMGMSGHSLKWLLKNVQLRSQNKHPVPFCVPLRSPEARKHALFCPTPADWGNKKNVAPPWEHHTRTETSERFAFTMRLQIFLNLQS